MIDDLLADIDNEANEENEYEISHIQAIDDFELEDTEITMVNQL
jgi:hypothetical protein